MTDHAATTGARRVRWSSPPLLELTRSSDSNRSRRVGWIALVVGLAMTAAVALEVRARERARANEAFSRRAAEICAQLHAHFRAPVESVFAVAALMGAHPRTDPQTFRAFAVPLLSRHRSLAALEWAEVVHSEERASFEARRSELSGQAFTIHEFDESGRVIRSPPRDLHVVMLLLEPFIAELVGFDFSFEAKRRAAMDATIRAGEALSTPKFRLVEDPAGVFSVAIYQPLFPGGRVPPTPEERRRAVEGLAIALYRIDPLMRDAISNVNLSDLQLELLDVDPELTTEDRRLFSTRRNADAQTGRVFEYQHRLSFYGRTWQVRLSRSAAVTTDWLWIAAVGVALSSALALLLSAMRTVRRIERQYDQLKSLGEYTLGREIGAGGMGRVFEAHHRILRRRSAIKLVRIESLGNDVVARFAREAQTTSELTHPNTVTLYDYGQTRDGQFYYVMEYLDGIHLGTLIERYGAQPQARVRNLVLQVSRALAEAHDKGFVHRDVKPENLMLCVRGGIHDFVKVLDFGLVKDRRDPDSGLSRAGLVLGTPLYMAPEVMVAPDAVGPTADVYALGAVAYLLLTGHPPFQTKSEIALASAHLSQAPPPINDADVQVDPAFEALIMKCLAKNPLERFATGAQLAFALERLAVGVWSEVQAAEWWAEHAPTREPPQDDETSAAKPRVEIAVRA